MGRATAGVIGMRLRPKRRGHRDGRPPAQGDGLLTVTNNGFGKRTDFDEYPKKGRGGLGVKTAMLTTGWASWPGRSPSRKDQDILVIANDGSRDPRAGARRSARRAGPPRAFGSCAWRRAGRSRRWPPWSHRWRNERFAPKPVQPTRTLGAEEERQSILRGGRRLSGPRSGWHGGRSRP